MKKQLPGWAVLLIITLVAGLALGGTNALTKDPIAEQARIKAENARKTALPDAESFEELTLGDGASVDWVYAGLKDGSPVGYVAQKTVNGFGGKVEVIAGVDTANAPEAFKIGGITVGGSDFSETAGLGARAKEPAFTDQFVGKVYPVSYIKAGGEATESTVDALTSATITTTAVVNGVNDIVKYVKADVMGIAGVEMPAKPADGVFSSSEKGFRGPVYVEAAFDGAGKVTYMKVGDENFAEDIGVGVVEPDFMIQFIGKQMPLEVSDIDVIAGATISSTAVVKALNNAYAIAGGAEIVVPETPTMPEKPAEGVFSASEQGFAGPVYTEAAFDADGKITYISVGDGQFAETEGFGARALAAENLHPFIGAQMPLNVEDVDALSGATFTKTAIVNGLNKAYKASKGEVEEEPVKEAATAEQAEPEATFGADAEGFQSTVHVEAAFDGDTVTYLAIGDKRFDETAGIGARALEPETAAAFIGKTVPLTVEDVDVLTGATFTKTAVVEALNKAYAKYQAAQEAPAEEAAPAVPDNAVTASAQGFGGPVAVTAAFEDGKVTYIRIGDDQFAETPGLGARALEEAFQAQFIGKQMPIALSDIDALAGATVTSTAVVDALNAAYASTGAAAEPAEEPAEEAATFTADADGFDGPVAVEAAFDGDKVTSLVIGDKRFNETAGLGARALEPEFAAQFIGKTVPLTVDAIDGLTGATFTKTAVVEALNKAYAKYQAAQDAPAEKAPAETTEEAISGSAVLNITAGFEDGKLASLSIVPNDAEAAMQEKFLGAEMPVSVDQDDATALTVAVAINKAYSRFLADQPVAAAEKEAEPEAAPVPEQEAEEPEGVSTVQAISFFTDIQVKAAFEDGKVSYLAIADKPVGGEGDYATSKQEAALQALFLGQAMPLTVDERLTPYAAAVAGALNQAFGPVAAPQEEAEEAAPEPVQEAAEEPAAEPVQEPAEEPAQETAEQPAASQLTLRVTAEFENETLSSLSVLEKAADSDEFILSPQEEALKEIFIGQPLPLDIKYSSALEATAAIAINKAYYDAAHEAEAQQDEAVGVIGGADGSTVTLWAVDGDEPTYVGEAVSFFTAIQASVRITPAVTVEAVEFAEKPVGAEEYHPSEQNDRLEALFVGESLPLDVKAYDEALDAAAAIAVNAAFAQSPLAEQEEDEAAVTLFGIGDSIGFFTRYTVAAAFENGALVTFGAYKAPLNDAQATQAIDCGRLNEWLDGRVMPLPTDDYAAAGLPEYETAAIVIALNQAYVNSLAGLQ